jgi:hypothetical protein
MATLERCLKHSTIAKIASGGRSIGTVGATWLLCEGRCLCCSGDALVVLMEKIYIFVGPNVLEDCFVGVSGDLGNFAYSINLYTYVRRSTGIRI